APRVGTMRERGSVTIVAAAVMAIVAVMTLATADLARVLIASARAQAAADAAALAAAQELALPTSGSSPETLADEYAIRNGAALVGCACAAGSMEAIVTVEVDAGGMLLVPGGKRLRARARAVIGTG